MNLRIPPLGTRGDHVIHLLSDYIDGCLSARATRGVEAHVAVCLGCARELEEWRSLLQLVSRHATVRCPIDCADVVLQRLTESGQPRTERGEGRPARKRTFPLCSLPPGLGFLLPRQVLWTATAVLLAALLGGLTWWQGSGTTRTSTTGGTSGMASQLLPAPAMHGEAPERLDGALGPSDSLILASDFAAEE